MEQFKYSHTLELSESEYADIYGIYSRRSRPWRRSLVVIGGVACLFWTYTLLLGIVLLGLACLAVFEPRMVPFGASSIFKGHAHLHQPLTFGVSDVKLSVSGSNLNLYCDWSNLAVWYERDGWLRVSPHGMQDLYFRVSDLQEKAVYNSVLELCRKHGKEFNSKD